MTANPIYTKTGVWYLDDQSWAEAGVITATAFISDGHGGDPLVLESLAEFGPILETRTAVVCDGVTYRGTSWLFAADGTVTITLPDDCPQDEPVTLYNDGAASTLDLHQQIKFSGCLLELPAPS
jgi:hypothetical protein